MSSVTAVLRKKANKQGQFPLAIRITKDRKSSYVYIGQYIDAKYWDGQNRKIRKSHSNSVRLNHLIAKKITEVNDKILESETNDQNQNVKHIKKQVKQSSSGNSFFQYAKSYLNQLEENKKYTRVSAESPCIKHFKEFVKNDALSFHEISESLLKRFQIHLKASRNVGQRTIMNHLAVIRQVFSFAMNEGDLDKKYYPFGSDKVKIKIPDSKKIGLVEEEVKLIENLNLKEKTPIWHARNVWLISFYFAGMRASDVLRLRWHDFQNNRLYYTMGKNEKSDSFKVLDKARALLEKYADQRESWNDYVFPELKKANAKDAKDVQRKINTAVRKFDKYLKEIAQLTGITKKLSMHIARHTFGNISGDKIPIQMLQKLYRHSSITTTIGYQANFIFKDTDDALDSVVNF